MQFQKVTLFSLGLILPLQYGYKKGQSPLQR